MRAGIVSNVCKRSSINFAGPGAGFFHGTTSGVGSMIITGSAMLIEAGSTDTVLEGLKGFPEVTFHVQSEEGTELVVNLEAEDSAALERLCQALRERIPDIVDISHIYVNFDEEIA